MSNSVGCYFSTKNISIITCDLYGEDFSSQIFAGRRSFQIVFRVPVPQPVMKGFKEHTEFFPYLLAAKRVTHPVGKLLYFMAAAVFFSVWNLFRHICCFCPRTPGVGKNVYR